MPTLSTFQQCFIHRRPMPNWPYHAALSLSLFSILFILISFIAILSKNALEHTLDLPLGFSLNVTMDYALFLFVPKVPELVITLMALLGKFVKPSWKKFSAIIFFFTLNFGIISLVLILVYGMCYLISCPPSANCIVTGYFQASIFVPAYFIYQALTVYVLYSCTKLSNNYLKDSIVDSASGNQQNYDYPHFYIYFGEISTLSQLAAMFFTASILILIVYLVAMWYIIWYLVFNTTYNIAFITLGFLSKLILLGTTTYGFKKKISSFIVSSLFISILGVVLSTVTLVAMFYAWNDSGDNPQYLLKYEKGPVDKCQFLIFCVLVYSLEILSFRSLFLGYKHCKKFVFPIEFRDRLLIIAASNVKCENLLGKGQFGEVWYGTLIVNNGSRTTSVAVKRLKPSATTEMKCWFLQEAILLSSMDHEHIVKPIGLCINSKPVMLCMEFLNGGSLIDYLHKDDTRKWLSQVDLVEIVLQVAKACCYLESEGIIHRDIAARNCLISCQTVHGISKPKVVKLADFGLAKYLKPVCIQIYRSERSIIPIPYTAPEGLGGSFNFKSDVWSFGVLVWEVFSWCARPYGKCHQPSNEQHKCPLHEHTNEQIESLIMAGRKCLLDFPEPCTASFNDCLKLFLAICWKYHPDDRPNFEEIKALINELKDNCSNSPCFPFQRIEELDVRAAREDDLTGKKFSITSTRSDGDDVSCDSYILLHVTQEPKNCSEPEIKDIKL